MKASTRGEPGEGDAIAAAITKETGMADSTDRRPVDIGRRELMIAGTGAALIAAGIDSLGTAQAQAGPSPTSPPTATAGAAAPGTIEVERRGSMLLVGLNRPQAENRLDPAMLIGLGRAWYQLDHDPDLRVAVLYAIGPDFCRVLDVPAYASAAAAGTYPPKDPDFLHPLNARPPFRTKPIVVAVQGRTGAVGHELFLAADVRVAASDTRFRQPEVAYGAFPGGGATVRFTREAGWANAMRYLLTGDEWSAEDAYRMGLVQEVTPPGKQLDRAIELAAKIADASPRGVRATLASAHQAISSEEPALIALLPEFQRIIQSDDAKEGQRALREGRKPQYPGG
jgi:enoyl-CoA hydratase